MKYQVGKPGRVVIARFGDGDDVLAGLVEIARKEEIRAAQFQVVGGLRRGRYVVGPAKEGMPPVPVWREFTEAHEVVANGTIFWQGEEPKIHCHGAYGRGGEVSAGCLRDGVETFLVLEAVITEIIGVEATRELDPVSGMVLLKL
ncbi:MAG: DNA-binding protein [Desulfuromonadales bacterium]|nr:DNA-binding protein [Desulfuromonadales bacterium]